MMGSVIVCYCACIILLHFAWWHCYFALHGIVLHLKEDYDKRIEVEWNQKPACSSRDSASTRTGRQDFAAANRFRIIGGRWPAYYTCKTQGRGGEAARLSSIGFSIGGNWQTSSLRSANSKGRQAELATHC
jgi:hypothetical protein